MYFCNRNQKSNDMKDRTQEEYFAESRRIRREVLQLAEQLKGNPMRFIITNEITMRVEITKTDLKTIFSRELGCRTILCMRRMTDGDIYKPYAIIDEHTFEAGKDGLRK